MKRVFVNGREVAPEDAEDAMRGAGILEGIGVLSVEEHADPELPLLLTAAEVAAYLGTLEWRLRSAYDWRSAWLDLEPHGSAAGWPEHRGPLVPGAARE